MTEIILEVVDHGELIGTLKLNNDKAESDQDDLADIVLAKYRLRGLSDKEAFEELRKGWSNGYWTVREKKEKTNEKT